MSENASYLKKHLPILLVPFLSIVAFSMLYIFRHVDDNRLTSWKWSFAGVDLFIFVPILLTGLIVAYGISRITYEQYNPALTLFITSFGVSAVFWSQPEVIIDASRYFTYAKHLELFGISTFLKQWGYEISPWTDLPLVPFVYGIIFKFIGESRMYIQIFNSLSFSFTAVLTYYIGRTLWNSELGFYAGMLLLGIPYVYSQVPLMLVDIPTMFLLTLCVYAFIKSIESGGRWILFSSAATFCTIFSKYSTWMMLSVLAVTLVVYAVKNAGRQIRDNDQRTMIVERRTYLLRGLSVAVITLVLTGLAFISKSDIILSQISFLQEYQAPGLRRWGEGFVSTFLFQMHPFITGAAILSLYVALSKRDPRFLIVSWLIFLIIVFQIKRSRYVMVMFPMYTLMASYGLSYIKRDAIKRYIVSSTVIFSVAVAIAAYLPFLKTMNEDNIKQAGMYLNSTDIPVIRVFTIPSDESSVNPAVTVPLLDLYAHKDIHYHYNSSPIPRPDDVQESSLRFTWEYKNPSYYRSEVLSEYEHEPTIVIISNGDDNVPVHIEEKLKGYEKAVMFNTTNDIFWFAPVVTIYLPSP